MASWRHALRALLLTTCLVFAGSAAAQAPGELRRIGVLMTAAPCPTPPSLVESLAALGWIEGRTVVFDCVSAVGRRPELSALAADLVARRPDVIASGYLTTLHALKAATATIPIVMLNAADPVRYGIVESLARPGGNVTGLASALGELDGKRIELLKEVVPKLSRFAAIAGDSTETLAPVYFDAVEKALVEADRAYGLTHQWFRVAKGEDLPSLFAEIAAKGFDAIYPTPSPFVTTNAALIGRSAQAAGLPTIGFDESFAQAGMLMSYGPSLRDSSRRAAIYIDKILKGAKPADLPVEQPTAFDLVINLKTAKALGVTIPASLQARATLLIED